MAKGKFMNLKRLSGCKPKPAIYRFGMSYEVDMETLCWNWIGTLNRGSKRQYGTIKVDGKSVGAHRFSWEFYNNQKIPDGMFVMHKCDNPKCVNPMHLKIGTHQDNMDDKVSKNRQAKGDSFLKRIPAKGSKNGLSKLNELQAMEIFKDNRPQRVIAQQYGISQTVVHNIKSIKTWKVIHDSILK
jgi:hypothetical protein